MIYAERVDDVACGVDYLQEAPKAAESKLIVTFEHFKHNLIQLCCCIFLKKNPACCRKRVKAAFLYTYHKTCRSHI